MMTTPRCIAFLLDGGRVGRRALLLVGILVWALGGLDARAQEDGGEQDPQLPEIAPREIEIRGELQIGFPSLERQPLRGFQRPARLPTLPPDRTPFTLPYRQTLAELPESRPAPVTVSNELQQAPPPANGMLEAGGGRYFTRHASGRLHLPVTATESFTVRADYDGSQGFEPFDDRPSVDTPYDGFDGSLRFDTHRRLARFGAELRGFWDRYTLYGADPVTGPPRLESPERTALSGGFGLSLHTNTAIPFALSLQYDQTRYDTQVEPDSLADALSFNEGRLAVNGRVSIPLGMAALKADGTVTTSGLDGGSSFDGDVVSFDGGAHGVVLNQGPYTVKAGARLLTFRAQTRPDRPTSPTVSATFLAPYVHAEWALTPSVAVFAQNQPGLQSNDLSGLYAENPFVEHAPSLRPTLTTTDASAGVELTTGPLRLRTHAGYRYAPSYLYFVPSTNPAYTQGLFEAAYDNVQIRHAGAEAALHGFDRVQASLRLTVRDAEIDGLRNPAVPNLGPILAEGFVSLSFLEQRGYVQLNATAESARYLDRSEREKVNAFVDVDLEGSFAVTPLLDVVARIQNVGAMEHWQHYPRPPAVITTGLRMHW